jgi:hypothetical protein
LIYSTIKHFRIALPHRKLISGLAPTAHSEASFSISASYVREGIIMQLVCSGWLLFIFDATASAASNGRRA